jgi:transcriptional adapter 2-alpha
MRTPQGQKRARAGWSQPAAGILSGAGSAETSGPRNVNSSGPVKIRSHYSHPTPPPTPESKSRHNPRRATHRKALYTYEDPLGDLQDHQARSGTPTRSQPLVFLFSDPDILHALAQLSEEDDSDAEEDARIERSMGVIRKNAASRGSDGGTKYHCDVCSIDITATVRISCANSACREYDLCVPCFGSGEKSKNHDPQTHEFHVVEQNSIPIYTEDWGADEELLLLEGSERYGLGSWADVSDHVGGYREKDEVRDHYIDTYINSPRFPLPALADPADTQLFEQVPKDEFQARKKRRIEERQESAKNAALATPKQKPTASVPACHEVQGFMPGRLEFETEFANDAEEAVQHMSFEPGDGIDPLTGEMDEETNLKMTVFDIYNTRLMSRTERKKIIFEHNLLEYKKNQLIDKKRTKEEKDIVHKAKPYARMMNHEEFEDLCDKFLEEHQYRVAIEKLQEYRQMGVTNLKMAQKYESDKAARIARNQPQGQFDRMPMLPKKNQQVQQPDLPSEASKLTQPELPLRFQKKPKTVPVFADSKPVIENDFDKLFAESTGTDTPSQKPKVRYVVQPLTGVTPWNLKEDKVSAPDLKLLSEEEIQLCNVVHMRPKPYLAFKDKLLKEAMSQGGQMKKKEAKAICKIEANKAGRIYDFMIHSGWIAKA